MANETVLVVGAGLIGCSSALHLLESGFEVTIVERDHDGQSAASFGNAGMVVPSHFVPLADPAMLRLGMKMMLHRKAPLSAHWNWATLGWMAAFFRFAKYRHVEASMPILSEFALRSRDLTASFASQHESLQWQEAGLSMVCRTRSALDSEAHLLPTAQRLGQIAELWDRNELQAREPDAGFVAEGAVHFPMDAHLNPRAYLEALRSAIRAKGGRLITGSACTKVLSDGIETTDGILGANWIVLALGESTRNFAKDLGLRMPMISGKGYSWDVDPGQTQLKGCAIMVEDRIAVTPLGDRLRISGGMQIGGHETTLRSATIAGICEGLPRYLPQLEPQAPKLSTIWAGHRPLSADGLPIIGPTSRHPRVLLATGHGMMGVTLAAATGELIAQAARKEPILRAFSPDRF